MELLPFTQDLSPENCRFLFVFNLLYIIQCITTFSSITTVCVCVTVFDAVSSNIDEIVWINPSANGFVLEEFSMHFKGWLTYSSWTDRLQKLCYDFSISNDLTFLHRSLTVTLTVLLFWICFFLLMLVCSTMTLSPVGNFDHVAVLVFIDFPLNLKGNAPFHV